MNKPHLFLVPIYVQVEDKFDPEMTLLGALGA